MTAKIEIVLDCEDPQRLAPFWADALGYKVLGSRDQYTALVPAEGKGPWLILQKVPEPKTVKNRVHIDVKVPDIEAEARRLEGLGAKLLVEAGASGGDWIVMADPEGNELCVCREGQL